jgi:voltage-gated potassium channel
MTYRNIKENVFEIIQPSSKGKSVSRMFDLFIMILIIISVVSVFLMTFDNIPCNILRSLQEAECATIFVFTVEYILRVWTADLLYPGKKPWRARLAFMTSPMAIIDLIAILPFYLPMLFSINLVGIRAIRLVRLLRIFKLNRYSDAFLSIMEVFREKIREILVSLFMVFLLLIVASLLIFYAEHDAQPQQFANAFSGLWWAAATLTTVGYGDIYPITPIGRILGAVIALLGIGMAAIPTGILSAGFVELLEKRKQKEKEDSGNAEKSEEKTPPAYCPHCGKKL